MTTSYRSFLGVPVEGDVPPGSPRAVQRPLSDLEPLLRAILADDGIVAFGWTQYTPYFNDGDRCEFEVNAPYFRTSAEDEDDLDEDDDDEYEYGAYEHDDEETDGAVTDDRRARCKALADAFYSGQFDDVLLDKFGDHARIRITRSGIVVHSYEHD